MGAYVVIWRYRVDPSQQAKFAKAHGPKGDWAKLFAGSKDYRGTELLADDDFTREDRLELWFGDRGPDYMEHCLTGEPTGLRQWVIEVREGRVLAGHGQPEIAGLSVARAGVGPMRLRIEPRSRFTGVTLVYVDRDDGESGPRRLTTSKLEPGRGETLGALAIVDPQAAACAVVAGRLEPVLRTFVGPGPVLQ